METYDTVFHVFFHIQEVFLIPHLLRLLELVMHNENQELQLKSFDNFLIMLYLMNYVRMTHTQTLRQLILQILQI